MLTKNKYSIKDIMMWTRVESFYFILYSSIICITYKLSGFYFISLPWTPIAMVGTAAAFIISFQNNAAYGRIWEARKIWGGIVNTSRSWGMKIADFVSNKYANFDLEQEELEFHKRKLISRHIAWLTALRHSMRAQKSWEVFEDHKTNREWSNMVFIPEKVTSLKDDLVLYLCEDELDQVMNKNNKAAAILYLQSKHITRLAESNHIWEFSYLELENMLQEMFALQGKSERIKNFPYPRQYASLNFYIVRLFLILLPLGLIPEFSKIGKSFADQSPIFSHYFVWLSIPFYFVVAWIFHTMERIGRVGENPFEGTANDVPISTIARGIEIDLRQLANEPLENIPCQFPENQNVQM